MLHVVFISHYKHEAATEPHYHDLACKSCSARSWTALFSVDSEERILWSGVAVNVVGMFLE